MKVKCEHLVRCGNSNCVHNQDGYYCKNMVISLDTTGACVFRKQVGQDKPNPNSDPFKGSNAC